MKRKRTTGRRPYCTAAQFAAIKARAAARKAAESAKLPERQLYDCACCTIGTRRDPGHLPKRADSGYLL